MRNGGPSLILCFFRFHKLIEKEEGGGCFIENSGIIVTMYRKREMEYI